MACHLNNEIKKTNPQLSQIFEWAQSANTEKFIRRSADHTDFLPCAIAKNRKINPQITQII
jgi:hypothetical protein